MKIGIIVYSYTNNTLNVAKDLESNLIKKGHEVEVKRITAVDENPNATSYQLSNTPSIDVYDAIIFGTCVRGFNCAPIFKQYFLTLNTLEDKKVAGFVSQFFPFDSLGGNQSLNCMERLVKEKGAQLVKLGSIHIKFRDRDKQMNELINKCDQWLKT